MSTFQHPSQLNQLQRYLQARAALRTTSRASNDAWYHDALALDCQLHIRIDGGPIRSWLHRPSENSWQPGPALPEQIFTDPDATDAFIQQLFQTVQTANTPNLGVILHVADEFAISELNPEHENPAALPELRALITTEPGRVIADSSLPSDLHAWRLFPYAGIHSPSFATAVTLSRRCENFLHRLRQAGEERNFPLRTAAISAPLCMLQALPFLWEKPLEHPIIAVFHYPFFTVLAFLSADGNVVLLRTLQHRGQRRPSNLRHAASTTAASLEFANPEVLVLPLADDSARLVADSLREVFPAHSVHLLDWSQTPFNPAGGVEFPEPLVALADTSAAGTPLSNALTFSAMRDEGWARQDFLPPTAEFVERFPNRAEMRLLRYARYARLGFAAAAALAIAWMSFTIIDVIRRPEWSFNPAEAKALQQRMVGLGVEQQRVRHWDNLLEDRSKAWTTMELLCRLFPFRSGILLSKTHHSVKPDNLPGQTRAGFVKEWRISGFAREESIERLTTINTQEGISAAFAEIAATTGNSAFATDLPSRTLVVNLRTIENAGFKPRPVDELVDSDESTYPFSFDLTITQRFESTDPIALQVTKAPKL